MQSCHHKFFYIDRWFNHISAAAEAYKQRTKNNNHDITPIEDPASVTIPNVPLARQPSSEDFIEFSLNATNPSVTAESVHNQSQEGPNDSVRPSTSHDDGLPLGEHDYINVNGSAAKALTKSESDVCDNKSVKQKSEIYSNNSNNTRTLTQQSSLVAPSEVHVSISPALTAEPVLTPNGTNSFRFSFSH